VAFNTILFAAGKRVTLYGWPHEKKNTFIFSGYVYHETPWETLEHYVSLTNETVNIATAFIEMALGIWFVEPPLQFTSPFKDIAVTAGCASALCHTGKC